MKATTFIWPPHYGQDNGSENRNFKWPFGVDKRGIECRAAKLSALIASMDWAGVGVDVL
jgi:hypothetical protein